MKKFLFNISLFILPFGLMVVATNFFVDPANVFNTGDYEEKIANIILKKHNVEGVRNCDDRLLFKKITTRLDTLPQVISVGSSRALALTQNCFTVPFRNCAMPHGNINDIIAVLGLFDSLHKLPKRIIIESTPFIKSEVDGEEWKTLSDYHKHFIEKYNIANIETIENSTIESLKSKFSKVVSLNYFQQSIRYSFLNQKKAAIDIGKNKVKTLGRYFDGSILYQIDTTKIRDSLSLIHNALNYVKNQGVIEFDEKKLVILKQLNLLFKQKNIEVDFLLVPYQPDCYNITKEKIEIEENKLKRFCKQHNINIIGSFNPNTFNMGRNDFADNLHTRNDELCKFLNIN